MPSEKECEKQQTRASTNQWEEKYPHVRPGHSMGKTFVHRLQEIWNCPLEEGKRKICLLGFLPSPSSLSQDSLHNSLILQFLGNLILSLCGCSVGQMPPQGMMFLLSLEMEEETEMSGLWLVGLWCRGSQNPGVSISKESDRPTVAEEEFKIHIRCSRRGEGICFNWTVNQNAE